MKQHKWAKEINAWAAGAEIEIYDMRWKKWVDIKDPTWNDEINEIQYRIKPQPKEPQYVYAWLDKEMKDITWSYDKPSNVLEDDLYKYIGKIKLEVDDEI